MGRLFLTQIWRVFSSNYLLTYLPHLLLFLNENPACMPRHVCRCWSSFLLTLFAFFQERTGLISLSDWSWRLLLHGDVWLLNSISRNDRSGKITSFFCIVCSFCAFLVKRWWMQLNTDHTKACLLKYFILDICQKAGFVCFRMCWRILMTLLLQLAVVEVHQELPLVTI